ncbi:MAG: hypothetical protein Q4Q62_05995 [Thermoplasmata archaeon]|nr:hypothetical protein [Thermoplasmata archaeon]
MLLFLGSGKTGKSATLFSTVELFFPDRKKCLLETWDFDRGLFPGYSVFWDLENIPPGSVVVIEDAARVFSSRGSASRTDLDGWLSLISHRDIVVLISVQSTAILDLQFFRTQRVVFMHKRVWDTDLKFERPELQSLQMTANLRLAEAAAIHPEMDPRVFTYCSDSDEVLVIPLVDWWTDAQSHYLRDARRRAKA